MNPSPTYEVAQREDGSWGVKRDGGEIQGEPLTEELAHATVVGATWATEYLVGPTVGAASVEAATAPSAAAITSEAAHSLAIRYNAYCTAEDDISVRVWGRLMLQSIDETGLFEQFRETITDRIENSLRREQLERERVEYAATAQ